MTVSERKKREARIELDQDVHLMTDDGVAHAITLKDLSRRGFKFSHAGLQLKTGEIVMIKSRRSEARVEILWIKDAEAGGIFV